MILKSGCRKSKSDWTRKILNYYNKMILMKNYKEN